MNHLWLCLLLIPLAACASTSQEAGVDPARAHDLSGLTAPDMKGQTHDLGALQAEKQPIALVFWQTWCASCLAEAPEVARAARENPEIHFLGVLSGPDELVDEFAVLEIQRKMGLDYPQLRDRELALTDHFEVQGTPTIILLDGAGHIVFRGSRVPTNWRQYL